MNDKKTLEYYIIYTWLYIHALLPLKCLYILSDILYFLVYKLVKYRLNVTRDNLRTSFPDKTEQELLKIEKKFYHFLCNYFVETIKILHISNRQMQKRMQFENIELIEQLMANGNSVLMLLGHYCNWEFIPSITLQFVDKSNITFGQIYKPLRNKAFDQIFLKIRSRFRTINIAKNDTLRTIIKYKRAKQQILIGFMADQTPTENNIYYWTNFLNQDTAIFTGVERIAKQTGFAVIYLDVARIKKGYYKATVKLITDNPQKEPEFSITEQYVRLFEESIISNPAYWLWSHKRWKRHR